MAYELEPVKPIGTHTALGAFSCPTRSNPERTECRPVSVDTYPKSEQGRRLRDLRRELGISLGETARCLDIDVVQVSALERGISVFKDPADWERMFGKLRASASTGIR